MESIASDGRVRTGNKIPVFKRIGESFKTVRALAAQEQSGQTSPDGFSFSTVSPDGGTGSPTLRDIIDGFVSEETAAVSGLSEAVASPEPEIPVKEPEERWQPAPAHQNNGSLPEPETQEKSLSDVIKQKTKEEKPLCADDSEPDVCDTVAPKSNRPERIEPEQIGADDYNQFMWETFDTPFWLKNTQKHGIHIAQNPHTGEWTVHNAESDNGITCREAFGTRRASAYSLLQETLNGKDVVIFDEGNVVNQKETQLAAAKQVQIKNAFHAWIFADNEHKQDNDMVHTDSRQETDIQEPQQRKPIPVGAEEPTDDFVLSH